MTERTASCPSCGAPIAFRAATTFCVVCESCGTAAYRTDVDVKSLGKVAELAPIPSVVSLGARGVIANVAWTVIGQAQLDWGGGPWNEWRLLFDDRREMWLAEAQGALVLSQRAKADVPDPTALSPGTSVAIGENAYVVTEVRRAHVASARGELPEGVAPGASYDYADLRGAGGRFATISDGAPPDVWVGRIVQASELGIDATSVAAPAERRVATGRFACPSCGTGLDLRDPEGTRRFTCEGCGQLCDVGDERVVVVGEGRKLESKPRIPLGSRGKLRGEDVQVLAYLVRSVEVDGFRYPWDEYLLRTKDGAHRWLVDAKGHWSLTGDVSPGEVSGGPRAVQFGGIRLRHFQGGKARVDHVQGEVHWRVAVGETVQAEDSIHVDPATGNVLQLSYERTDAEVVWSRAEHVPPDELRAAFPDARTFRVPDGVGICQPNPWMQRRSAAWKASIVLLVLALAAIVLVPTSCSGTHVATMEVLAPVDAPSPSATPSAATPAPEDPRGVAFSPEFDLTGDRSNVEVSVSCPVSNAWVGIDGALVEIATGEAYGFAVEAERWSGVEGGESWSEGSGRGTETIGGLPPGRYALRVQAASSGPGAGTDGVRTNVYVRTRVMSVGRLLVVLLVIALPPLAAAISVGMFEARRWSESDHPPGG